MIVTILLILSLLLNGVLVFSIRNLLIQNETLENVIVHAYEVSDRAYRDLLAMDTIGAFQADDEVGTIFESIRGIVADLTDFLGVEEIEENINP